MEWRPSAASRDSNEVQLALSPAAWRVPGPGREAVHHAASPQTDRPSIASRGQAWDPSRLAGRDSASRAAVIFPSRRQRTLQPLVRHAGNVNAW